MQGRKVGGCRNLTTTSEKEQDRDEARGGDLLVERGGVAQDEKRGGGRPQRKGAEHQVKAIGRKRLSTYVRERGEENEVRGGLEVKACQTGAAKEN